MDQAPNPLVLLGQLTGYGLSMTLSVILAVLAWCSPGQGRTARFVFAACATAWSLCGLLRCVLLLAGFGPQSIALAWIECLALSAASIWPVALFMLWRASAVTSVQQRTAQWLIRLACASAALLTVVLVSRVATGTGDEARMAVAYNALALMLGGLVLMRRLPRSTPERVGIVLMFIGPCVIVSAHLVARAGLLSAGWGILTAILIKQSVFLAILGGLFFLGRFRAADRFARLSLRVLLAWSCGVLLAWSISGPLPRLASHSVAPEVTLFVVACAAIASSMFLFTLLARLTDSWVEHQVFGKVDPTLALRQLREELSQQEVLSAVLTTAEEFIKSLQLDVRISPNETGAAVHSERHDFFPIRVGKGAPYVLEAVERPTKRALLDGELDVLQQVADLVGRRLEGLEREFERMDRTRREASLLHQLVEAELRALRAQVNPHFLFNSLNTIAALVHQDPVVAEAMTVRLAKIFRHVLVQTERPFSSLAEEMQFLQAYLEIEQIRFGERLKVDFQVTDAVRNTAVPSLILQPLVENAIRHGLAPKLGECRLLIEGSAQGSHIVLRVQDNGVGTRTTDSHPSSGVGLRNVRERLLALYGERARLSFESEPRAGTCASVYLPLTGT